jgi:hypothetical protein
VPEPKNPQSYNRYSYSYNNPINYTDPSGHMATSGCDGLAEGCLSDPKYWGASFVYYLRNHIDFNDPASNPQGQIFLELYNYVLPLGQADGASINEIVSQVIVDTVSFVKHGRDSWYPIASDADLLVKTLLFASVAEAGTDSSINGEQGSVIPQYNRARYGSFKASTYREVLARDNSTCFYCGRHGVDVDLELDHVTPVKTHWFRGGYAMTDTELNAWYNNADNLVTACRSCNRSKGTSSGLFFMLRRIFGGQ